MEDLTRLLEGTLSNDTTCREVAEAHLTNSMSTPGFALVLTQYIQAPLSLPLAQLAAVLLKKVVLAHWEAGEDSTYVISDNEKTEVRNVLMQSLGNLAHGNAPSHFEDSKFQTAYSLVLAELGKLDWPEKWPALVPGIIELMTTHTAFALKFFSVATDNIASDHFVELVPVLFPHLERVFDASTTPTRFQGRVVAIVQTCLTMLGMMSQSGESAQAGAVLQSTVTPWIGRFLRVLEAPPSQDLGLYIVIVRALTSFIVEWPKDMSSLVPSILPPVWQLLLKAVEDYETHVVLGADGVDGNDDGYDSDGEPNGQAALTMELMDFVRGLVHAPTKKTKVLVTQSLQPLVHTMVAYMQITRAQLELWSDDPNQYIIDEDDDSLQHNVRNTGADLLRELEATLGSTVLTATIQATQRRLAEPSWRLQEAALLVMGALAEPLLMTRATVETNTAGLDLPQFLATLFDVMHAAESNIYLKARALWCASRFATVMTEAQLVAFIQASISGLDRAQVIPVKLYACRALGTFVQHEKAVAVLPPFATTIVERLVHLTIDATPETLHVVLETLALVVVDAADVAQPILRCVVPLWVSHLDDRLVHDVVVDILAVLVANAAVAPAVLDHVVPPLGNVFHSLYVLQAIEVIELLVKQPAVAPLVVPVLLDPLLGVLLTTDDGSLLQHGGDVLKYFVMHASPQLEQFKTTTGVSGLDGVMQVVAKLLSPGVSDSGAMAVGGLVTQVLLRLSAVLPVVTVHQLLHAVSTRLGNAQMPSLIQSLCTVFARLVHSFGVKSILDALESLGVLSFVVTTWIEHQDDFYGLYSMKVTLLALLKLLESQDPRVLSLVVKGEQLIETGSTRSLRSSTKAQSGSRSQQIQYSQVSFATKLVGLLAMTYVQFEDEAEADDMNSSDEEDGDDDYGDDEAVRQTTGGCFGRLTRSCLDVCATGWPVVHLCSQRYGHSRNSMSNRTR
ncbi:hypothetical protein, variant [Aphanomyces invadans]|uniref:Importin N-terminal domain-containing protein n=1 Tax=Aphanomyces invadans TaxID=157072 RepID=A0A024U7I5_9STRA|nr:hypothetical protein, variant [Aphanomyces invadans]ETW01563.1 hypothetical protein, variant [Aphanomyces invadans]|eukprot:XP_008869411.1 hypothetical protein, variant [Aphanomyces invadans]